MKRFLPWILAALCLLWAADGLVPRNPAGFDIDGFGRLPVLLNGRIQPFDSVARNSLLEIRTRQSARVDGRKMPAMEWLLELMTRPDQADERKVFRVDNREVLGLMSLSEEEQYFSFADIRPHQAELSREGDRVQKIEAAQRTAFERGVMKLYSSMWLYQRLKATLQPPDVTDFSAELEDYAASIDAGVKAVRAREAGESFDNQAFNRLLGHLSSFDQMSRMAYVRPIPPAAEDGAAEDWNTVGAALMTSMQGGAVPDPVLEYARMAAAYAAGDSSAFNATLDSYSQWLKPGIRGPPIRAGRSPPSIMRSCSTRPRSSMWRRCLGLWRSGSGGTRGCAVAPSGSSPPPGSCTQWPSSGAWCSRAGLR